MALKNWRVLRARSSRIWAAMARSSRMAVSVCKKGPMACKKSLASPQRVAA